MLEHKGYLGIMEVDADAGNLFGRVIGLRDVITFQGETVAEAIAAFRDSVDDYLAWCTEKGDEPERPFSGKFVLRLPPDLHRTLAAVAEVRGKSLNSLVSETLAQQFGGAGNLQMVPAASRAVPPEVEIDGGPSDPILSRGREKAKLRKGVGSGHGTSAAKKKG